MSLEMWRKPPCCGGTSEAIVQIDIYGDGRMIGLVGLTTIFEQLHSLGRVPDASVQDKLVKMVAAKNYVPTKDETMYGAVLAREYAKFCAEKNAQAEGIK